MATIQLADPTAPGAGPGDRSIIATAFVTAAELKWPLARPCTFGRTGTLRRQDGRLAFEGSDGRLLLEASLSDVGDVVRHRSGLPVDDVMSDDGVSLTLRGMVQPPCR